MESQRGFIRINLSGSEKSENLSFVEDMTCWTESTEKDGEIARGSICFTALFHLGLDGEGTQWPFHGSR